MNRNRLFGKIRLLARSLAPVLVRVPWLLEKQQGRTAFVGAGSLVS